MPSPDRSSLKRCDQDHSAGVMPLTVGGRLPEYVYLYITHKKNGLPGRCHMLMAQRDAIKDYAFILGLLAILIYLWLQ